MSSLSEALASGALASLEELHLQENEIGDAGCTALAEACGRGALANLSELCLYGNQIGHMGRTALAEALGMWAVHDIPIIEGAMQQNNEYFNTLYAETSDPHFIEAFHAYLMTRL